MRVLFPLLVLAGCAAAPPAPPSPPPPPPPKACPTCQACAKPEACPACNECPACERAPVKVEPFCHVNADGQFMVLVGLTTQRVNAAWLTELSGETTATDRLVYEITCRPDGECDGARLDLNAIDKGEAMSLFRGLSAMRGVRSHRDGEAFIVEWGNKTFELNPTKGQLFYQEHGPGSDSHGKAELECTIMKN